MKIRPAEPGDAPGIAEIYAHYVEATAASFEESPPAGGSCSAERIAGGGLPFVVAERDGQRGRIRLPRALPQRSAYRYTAENSVYVAHDARGAGIGRALLERLLEEGRRAGIREVIAIIGLTDERTSVDLHRAFGFDEVGRLRAVGFKHGRWYDTVFMQRSLQPPPSEG